MSATPCTEPRPMIGRTRRLPSSSSTEARSATELHIGAADRTGKQRDRVGVQRPSWSRTEPNWKIAFRLSLTLAGS